MRSAVLDAQEGSIEWAVKWAIEWMIFSWLGNVIKVDFKINEKSKLKWIEE